MAPSFRSSTLHYKNPACGIGNCLPVPLQQNNLPDQIKRNSLMSLNDKDVTLGGAKGTDIYPGVANPTSSSNTSNPLTENFVQDPTSDEAGAGAGPGFRGGRDAKAALKSGAGVVEARPGIIESTQIAPLQEDAGASLE
ncbi:hypothetical protein FRC00_012519 [Tulasnella sp. 408]|nr:hypothetical protein FRC00_012519 [Tulasnella sp. 408]